MFLTCPLIDQAITLRIDFSTYLSFARFPPDYSHPEKKGLIFSPGKLLIRKAHIFRIQPS
jgi:hypothetical protein